MTGFLYITTEQLISNKSVYALCFLHLVFGGCFHQKCLKSIRSADFVKMSVNTVKKVLLFLNPDIDMKRNTSMSWN